MDSEKTWADVEALAEPPSFAAPPPELYLSRSLVNTSTFLPACFLALLSDSFFLLQIVHSALHILAGPTYDNFIKRSTAFYITPSLPHIAVPVILFSLTHTSFNITLSMLHVAMVDLYSAVRPDVSFPCLGLYCYFPGIHVLVAWILPRPCHTCSLFTHPTASLGCESHLKLACMP